jgi:toxin ParE1/3/4
MGGHKVIFSPRADNDLRIIVKFIAYQGNPVAAEKLGNNLIEKALSLSEFPERGRIVPEAKDRALREIFFKSYRIVYRVRDRTVEIARFWHAARGVPEIDSDEFSRS